MTNYDVKAALKHLYAPKADDFVEVDVPELSFLMVDGEGSPGVAPAYAAALEALYGLSYGVRFLAKAELGRVHTVGPLEGLWWADDPSAYSSGRRDEWKWTLMISQPHWITQELVTAASEKKGIDGVRLEPLTEGRCVQILHVGPYADEAPTLARLHDDYMPERGLTFNGHHHEIYLSDARRVPAEKLRTVLRQPVRAL